MIKQFLLFSGAILMVFMAGNLDAQPATGRVFKARIKPNWNEAGDHFWYRNELADGHEFVLVDCKSGKRELAFDHGRLAVKLVDVGTEATGNRLPIQNLTFDLENNIVTFASRGKFWTFDRTSAELKPATGSGELFAGLKPLTEMPRQASRGGDTNITFENRTQQTIEIFWLSEDGRRVRYAELASGKSHSQHTFSGHLWEVVGKDGKVALFQATDQEEQAVVETKTLCSERPGRSSRRNRTGRRPSLSVSPDGKLRARIVDHNVVIIDLKTKEEVPLTTDGTADAYYGLLSWSPDSKALGAFRIRPVESKRVYRVNSALGKNQFRGELQQQGYPLPGDEFTKYEPSVFDVSKRLQMRPEVDPVDFGRPRWYWYGDHKATYQKIDRGHQRFRLVEIDGLTGNSRNLVDEKSETFIWTAHNSRMRFPKIRWLQDNRELIFTSEQDGYRQLFLVDVKSGKIKNTITPGEYVVTGIDGVDEENRTLQFRASGKNKTHDPYFVHFYRVRFDGTGLVELTQSNGTHSLQYSPTKKYYIDTYSRVDLPPIHELHRSSDGKRLCVLEKADASSSGWRAPTVFVAKGRDDKTDIWGFIEFPKSYDPNKKYPIIESIYAGPHDFHTPKTFSPRARFQQLTDLGFVVVKLDGMGTAGRSKAFHDVCWQNLKDAGFPDRIKWIKAAAEKYPGMDTSRVGIYGTSAGGQSAAGALLFHGDFYDVAVASCGCHDNRMDKASWNEQWMGYPVGPHYAASSNIDNAKELKGHLMLIIGEVDNNVPPASTFKFANELIRHNKDFEMVYLPGVGHSSGGAYGNRKRIAFFREHLLGPTAGEPSGD